MKNFRMLPLIVVALVLALGFSNQLLAQDSSSQNFTAVYVGPADSVPDVSSSFPGFGTGVIGMYAPIPGTPCFGCFGLPPGAMAIGPAVAVATHGKGYTWFFTLQTSTVSGNISLLMRLIQNGNEVGPPLAGTRSFNPRSVYVVFSTLPVITPNTPGATALVVGLHQSGVAVRGFSAPLYIQ
jgi:hypothetical protein